MTLEQPSILSELTRINHQILQETDRDYLHQVYYKLITLMGDVAVKLAEDPYYPNVVPLEESLLSVYTTGPKMDGSHK